MNSPLTGAPFQSETANEKQQPGGMYVCMKRNLMSPQNTLQISIFLGSVPPDPPRTILGPLFVFALGLPNPLSSPAY